MIPYHKIIKSRLNISRFMKQSREQNSNNKHCNTSAEDNVIV